MEEYRWDPNDPYKIVGVSQAVKVLRETILKYCVGLAPVVITGETGTGKELVARTIHRLGNRAQSPFVPVDCGGLSDSLLEAELFGYDANAFTGAARQGKKGAIEAAHQGILYLDEVGNLSVHGQMALLRVLQEREVRRIGAPHEAKSDFRLVSATGIDLNRALEEGCLRKDFYFRIKGITIWIPPLRERNEDIPYLVDHFIKKYAQLAGMERKEIDPNAMMLLMDYQWPGNIRQLERVIETALYTKETRITADTIEEVLVGHPHASPTRTEEIIVVERVMSPPPSPSNPPYDRQGLIEKCLDEGITPWDYKREIAGAALQKAGGNKSEAARSLGIVRSTLDNWLAQCGPQSGGNGNSAHAGTPTEVSGGKMPVTPISTSNPAAL